MVSSETLNSSVAAILTRKKILTKKKILTGMTRLGGGYLAIYISSYIGYLAILTRMTRLGGGAI